MRALIAGALLALIATPAAAQNITAPHAADSERHHGREDQVPGPSLRGNLEGNDTNRQVMVVLPPSYASNPNKRYPVVYYLHGFAIDGENFYNYMHVPEAVAHNAAAGASSSSWCRAR
jgi:enterochelin esterase-like enzyme